MDNLPQPQTAIPADVPAPAEEPSIIPAEEPSISAAAEPPATPILGTLGKLAEASKAKRLAPAEEEQATALLKELLSGGKEGMASAIEPLIALPWIVSVNAVSAFWPEWKLPTRRRLLSTLAKNPSEQARRLRLSLARAIFKIEPPAGLKLAAAAAADLKDPETGALPSRSRQIFFNVFIGKGKPWLLQLALGDLKGSEADTLIHCAMECYPLCPPLSQLSILRWAHGAGRFKKLSASDLEIATKAIARWNSKLQSQLKEEIPDLPEAITAVFKAEAKAAPASSAAPSSAVPEAKTEPGAPGQPSQADFEAPDVEEHPEGEAVSAETEATPSKPSAPPEELVIPRRAGRQEKAEPAHPKDRHKAELREDRFGGNREDRQRDEKGRKPFDFRESVRSLESYVAGLRSELEQTKAQLRRKEEDVRRGDRGTRSAVQAKPAVDAETLLRHNAQLETTVEQLRQQLEDLASHDEAVAESRLLHTSQPMPEGTAEQLTALLAIKLKESYSTYEAMRAEPLDRVFRLDYRDLLGSVFDVLLQEGVKLQG